MDLTKENVKKLRGLIVFTAVIVVCLWKYEASLKILFFIWGVVRPFILGGAIAFVLNVPMNFIQRHLFPQERIEHNKIWNKLARPVSMLIVLFLVIATVGLVMFVLIPQLGNTFANLGQSIQNFIPQIQEWAEVLFHNNKEVMDVINHLEFDWNKIMNTGFDFFTSGAGSVLDSTISAAKSIINGITTFFIAFAFAIYILMQKEKLLRTQNVLLIRIIEMLFMNLKTMDTILRFAD